MTTTATQTEPRLPRADDAERYLLECLVVFPQRAHEILPLAKSTDFFEPLHQSLWRTFTRQHAITGEIDILAAGKKLGCADYLLELSFDCVTSVHAESRAKLVKDAARARAVHDICQRGADAILHGRSGESVLASLQMAMEGFQQA